MERGSDNEKMEKKNDTSFVPIVDLRAQYQEIQWEIDRAVQDVLESGWYIFGNAVGKFEEEMRSYLSIEAAFGCGNGTDALTLAMMAYGFGPGDEVILPAFSFVAPLEAIVLCGAKPCFVDVDPASFNIDPDGIEVAMTPATKAIIVVHLYGQCCDMDRIMKLARERGVRVIEDAAQSFGASRSGRRAGSMGDICCFSFYPTKNLSCMGDGGMIGTGDPDVVDKIRFLRNHGEVEKYRHAMVGMNSRLDELQAAILLAKLPFVERWNKKRAEIAARYDQEFKDLDLTIPTVEEGNVHIYHQYTLQSARRDRLIAHLQTKNIATAVHYPFPLTQQPAYTGFVEDPDTFPVANRLSQQVLSLPIFPQMSDDQVVRVIEGVRSYFVGS